MSFLFTLYILVNIISIIFYFFRVRELPYNVIRDRKYVTNMIIMVTSLVVAVLSLLSLTLFRNQLPFDKPIAYNEPTYTESLLGWYSSIPSITIFIVAFAFATTILFVTFRNYRHVVFGATILSSVTIIGSLLTVEKLNVDELVVLKRYVIENQNYNVYKNDSDLPSNDGRVKQLKLIDEVVGFKSGSSEVPEFDWEKLEEKLLESQAKFLVLSGFSDPHKIKDASKVSNLKLAESRAISVQKEIENLEFFKNSGLEIFIVYDGVENGVKLFEYQIEMYHSERKVKIYVGV